MVSLRDEKGQALIEYVLLQLLLILVFFVGLRLLVEATVDQFVRSVCVTVNSPDFCNPPRPCGLTRDLLGGPAVEVTVNITSPKHCAQGLPGSIKVEGTYSGDLTGKEIWVLVMPEKDHKLYPQTPDACQKLPANASGGFWETRAHFGGPPQQYDVIAVVTKAQGEASQEFKVWLERGCSSKHYPGYLKNELPAGITEMDFITVRKGRA